jgi:hypothetical protein
LNDPPLRVSEHDNRNRPALQILRRRYILVGRQEHVKASCLGSLQ